MGKHYQGPPPHHGGRIYGQRLLVARQLRGLSRNGLGTKLNIEASRLRAMEAAEYTVAEGREDITPQLSWLLDFPPRWFQIPMGPEFTDAAAQRNTFLCQSMEDRTCECGGEATLLCDEDEAGGGGTCDAPLCDHCTKKRNGKDRCGAHSRAYREAGRGKTSGTLESTVSEHPDGETR